MGYRDQCSNICFVYAGKCRAEIHSASAEVIGSRDLEPGDIFGKFAAIDRRQSLAGIAADKDSLVTIIRSEKFREAIANAAPILQAIIMQ